MKRSLMFVVPALLVLSISVASAQVMTPQLKMATPPATIDVKPLCQIDTSPDGSKKFVGKVTAVQHDLEPGEALCVFWILPQGCTVSHGIFVTAENGTAACSAVSSLRAANSSAKVTAITTVNNILKEIIL